jgi:NRPS condensation-like uncharacterized protein
MHIDLNEKLHDSMVIDPTIQFPNYGKRKHSVISNYSSVLPPNTSCNVLSVANTSSEKKMTQSLMVPKIGPEEKPFEFMEDIDPPYNSDYDDL